MVTKTYDQLDDAMNRRIASYPTRTLLEIWRQIDPKSFVERTPEERIICPKVIEALVARKALRWTDDDDLEEVPAKIAPVWTIKPDDQTDALNYTSKKLALAHGQAYTDRTGVPVWVMRDDRGFSVLIRKEA